MFRLTALAVLACVALARPAFADDGVKGRQQAVRQSLAQASVEITALDAQVAGIEARIAGTEARVARERGQVRLLARAVYAEPSSPLLVLLGAPSLAAGLTRVADLTAAADRAEATRRALDSDLGRLRAAEADLRGHLARALILQRQLDAEYRLLMAEPAGAGPGAAPASPSIPLNPSVIQQLILTAFAPLGPAAQTWALRVAKCESGYNPNAVNRYSGASGLFQFMPRTWARTPWASKSVFDPVANAQAAAWYYNATGRTGGPWSCK